VSDLKAELVTLQKINGRWFSRAQIHVPGLGTIEVKDCISDSMRRKICKQAELVCEQRLQLVKEKG